MSDHSVTEAVEGQSLAQAILAGDPNGWPTFSAKYGQRLLLIAKKAINGDPILMAHLQAEDLTQSFLAKIVKNPSAMLTVTAEGIRPLWPRISASLVNHSIDLRRKLKHEPRARLFVEEAHEPFCADNQSSRNSSVVLSQIADLTLARVRAIRDSHAVSLRTKAPLCCILLLSERLHLAEQIAFSFVSADNLLPSSVNPATMAAKLEPWKDAEKNASLPPSAKTLDSVWQQIAGSCSRQPYRIDGSRIAEVLEVRRNTYDKWLARARHRVVTHLGVAQAHELFPCWPEGLFKAI